MVVSAMREPELKNLWKSIGSDIDRQIELYVAKIINIFTRVEMKLWPQERKNVKQ